MSEANTPNGSTATLPTINFQRDDRVVAPNDRVYRVVKTYEGAGGVEHVTPTSKAGPSTVRSNPTRLVR